MTKSGIRKQIATNADFQRLWDEAQMRAPDLEQLVVDTVRQWRSDLVGQRVGLAWSEGGKDGMVLGHLAVQVGLPFQGMLGLCQPELEFPEVERWLADHHPDWLTVIRSKQDLDWLAAKPERLFPDHHFSGSWSQDRQWKPQRAFYRAQELDVMVIGRRRADGNCMTRAGKMKKYLPLEFWSHAHVFAYVQTRGIELGPFYGWPNGFVVGTGPWGKRLAASRLDGFRTVASIDPTILDLARSRWPEAEYVREEIRWQSQHASPWR